MNDAAVRQIVQSKIADGRLPRYRTGAVYATHGADELCDACSASVTSEQILYTLSRTGSRRFAFHRECFGVWQAQRNSMTLGPAVMD